MFDLGKISQFFKKSFQKKDWLIIFLLIVGYFATRLINLDKFPIFSDEGIYIRWAKVAWHDATWRFISLTDGKQPLQTWGTIPFLKLFPNNLLLAGRLFSTATGFAALLGIFSLCFYLFGKRAALFASLFYVLTPCFLFYDRMALVDSGVNAGFIWILFFSILLARNLRLDTALLLGLISGVSLLAKSSVHLFVGLASFAPILFMEKGLAKFFKKLADFSFLYIIAVVLALIIYNVQRLSPFLHFVTEKNKTFIMTFSEFKATPFAYFFDNIKNVPLYVFWESALILPLIGIAGFGLVFKKSKRLFFYLLIWLLLPYVAITFFSKILFPRYLIFFGSLFLIPASYFLANQKRKTTLVLIIIYLVSVTYFNYTLLFDYKNIPFPAVDRGQYLEGWPAGWGAKEIVQFARAKSQEKPVILLAEGNFGMAGDVLDTFLQKNDRITIRGYWPLEKKELAQNQEELKDKYVYAVFSHRAEFPSDWSIHLIKKFDKPADKSAIYLFELLK